MIWPVGDLIAHISRYYHLEAGDLIYTTATPRFGAFPIFLSGSNDPTLRHRMTAVFN